MASTNGLAGRIRRATRNPFRRDLGPATLVHCGHHKVGTHWFGAVLGDVAAHFGREFVVAGWSEGRRQEVAAGEVVQFPHSRDFAAALFQSKAYRGSHLVRDPRDVAVSAYHYHRWTDEPWVNVPSPGLGGKTYQEHLNSLPTDEGLLVEIERTCATIASDMRAWTYDRPEFIELRYEDFIEDEEVHFRQLFTHYGFNDAAIGVALELVTRHSFSARAGRVLGEIDAGSPLRSGMPGQWREAFGPEHVATFTRLANDVLIRLGYERDAGWGI